MTGLLLGKYFLIFSVGSNILNNINIFYYHTILRGQENCLLNFQYPGKLFRLTIKRYRQNSLLYSIG